MMWRITILLLTILFYPKNVKLKFLSFSLFVAPRGGGDDVDFARPLGAPKTAKRVSSAPVGKGRSSSLTSSKGISSGKKHNFLLHPLTRIGLTSPVFEIFVKTNMHLVWFWSQPDPIVIGLTWNLSVPLNWLQLRISNPQQKQLDQINFSQCPTDWPYFQHWGISAIHVNCIRVRPKLYVVSLGVGWRWTFNLFYFFICFKFDLFWLL